MTVTSQPKENAFDESPCGRYQRDWDLLALGALEADLEQEMSLHLRACPACQQSFLNSEQVADAIATVCPDEVAPVVDRLIAERAASKRSPKRFWLPSPPKFLPWALVAASVACLVFVGHERDGLVDEIAVLRTHAICPTSVHQVELRSVDPQAGRAAGHAMWSDGSGLLFTASGLPDPPKDTSYELWILHRSEPEVTSAGFLTMAGDGHGIIYLAPGASLSGARGFVLTHEIKGATSRGRKLLTGELQ